MMFFCYYCEKYRPLDAQVLMTSYPMCNSCYMTKLYPRVIITRKHYSSLEYGLIQDIVLKNSDSYLAHAVRMQQIERKAKEDA